jgi:hypothetical protein
MNKQNIKKITSSIISIVIIAGMALQAFATNVDMAAFVERDQYDEKFNEIEWRIDDIQKSLERMYKFTCTNVKTWVGRPNSVMRTMTPFSWGSTTPSQNSEMHPLADLSEEGYLRVNYAFALTNFANHDKTDKFYVEIPAARCRWNDGIEPAPNCMIRIESTRNFLQPTTSGTVNANGTFTFTMGPFKKFKKFTSTGSSKTSGAIVAIPKSTFGTTLNPSAGNLQYAYGKTTMPTSWTTDSTGRIYFDSIDYLDTNSIHYDNPFITIDEYKTNPYDINKQFTSFRYYFSALPTADFSQYENIWIRYNNISSTSVHYTGSPDMNLTTWNTGK